MAESKFLEQVGNINESQIEETKTAIESTERILVILSEELDILQGLKEMISKYPRRLNPEYEYETKDEYWELDKRFKINDFDKKIVNYTKQVKDTEGTLQKLKDRLAELQGE